MAESPSELRVEIEKLERKHAENPEGRFFVPLANAYRKLGAVEHAESLLRDGLRRHPDYLSAHVVLGRCLADQRAVPAAVEEFRYVLSLDPQNLIALRSLAELALVESRSSDAAHWYRELLSVDPMNEDARRALEELAGPVAGPSGAAVHAEPPMRDDWLHPLDESTGEGGYSWDETEAAPGDHVMSEPADDLGLVHFDGDGEREEEERSPFDAAPLELDRPETSFEGGELHAGNAGPADLYGAFPADPASALESTFSEDPFHPAPSAGAADDAEQVDDDDGPGELATETIAELYARQGFYARAADVLREVIRRRGGDEALARRLAEIERLAAGGELEQAESGTTESHEAADLAAEFLDVGQPGVQEDAVLDAHDSWSDSEHAEQPAADEDTVRFGFLELESESESGAVDAGDGLPALPGLNGGFAGGAAAAGGAAVGRFQFDDSATDRTSEPVEEDPFADSFTHGFYGGAEGDSTDHAVGAGEDGGAEGAEAEPWGGEVYAATENAAGSDQQVGSAHSEEEPWAGEVYAATAEEAGEQPQPVHEVDAPEGETITSFLRGLVAWKRDGSDATVGAAAGATAVIGDAEGEPDTQRESPAAPDTGGFASIWSPEGEAGSAGDADDSADIASIWEPAEQAAAPSVAPDSTAPDDDDAMPDWLDVGPGARSADDTGLADRTPAATTELPAGTGSAADDELFPWEEPMPAAPAPEPEPPAGDVRRERGTELEDYLAFDEEPVRSAGAPEEAGDSLDAYLAYGDETGAGAPEAPAVEPESAPEPPAAAPPSAPTPAAATQEDEDDLESFQTWLRSLKR